jgi:hypothetical protein
MKDEINERLVFGGRVPARSGKERGAGVEEIAPTTERRENGSAREEGRCSGEAQVGGWRPWFGMGVVGFRGMAGLRSVRRHNPSLKLTRLSPRLHLGGWAESGAGQRYVSGKAAAQLSSDR